MPFSIKVLTRYYYRGSKKVIMNFFSNNSLCFVYYLQFYVKYPGLSLKDKKRALWNYTYTYYSITQFQITCTSHKTLLQRGLFNLVKINQFFFIISRREAKLKIPRIPFIEKKIKDILCLSDHLRAKYVTSSVN